LQNFDIMAVPTPSLATHYNPADGALIAGEPRVFIIPDACAGLRIDVALAQLWPEHSRSRLRSWIDAGRVTLAGVAMTPKQKVGGGEHVLVAPLADPRAGAFVAQEIPLTILYEDDALLVIDKPEGLVVHPGSGNWEGTMANALLHHAPQLARVARAGIVHRLDKDTSGLLVVAKTETAQTDLVRQLQARTVRREYLALAGGDIARAGKVDAPIGRHPVKRTSMAVVHGGKPAITHYEVRERFGDCTLLMCRLETGRTHQIRVHLASIGHPLLGDAQYRGPRMGGLSRQALHAWRLGLLHPLTRAPMQWESPLPTDFAGALDGIRARAMLGRSETGRG
jgi:23S rRNA pseudouridine1911/1915/1917 synthase